MFKIRKENEIREYDEQGCYDMFKIRISSTKQQTNCFLTAFSALAWCVWKQKNLMCFEQKTCASGRTIILSIITTMIYWTGTGTPSEEMQQWMPVDVTLIPIQGIPPCQNP